VPEIVSCLACGKETYAALATCAHCQQPLRFEKKPLVEDEFQPDIPVEEFATMRLNVDMTVKLDTKLIKSSAFYLFAPKYYSLEMTLRFFLFPATAIGLFAVLFIFHGAYEFPDGSERGYGRLFGAAFIAVFWFLGSKLHSGRKRFLEKQIYRDRKSYETAVKNDLIHVARLKTTPADPIT